MCLYTCRLQTNDGLYTNMLKYPFKVKGAKNLYNSKTDFSGSCIYTCICKNCCLANRKQNSCPRFNEKNNNENGQS